MISHIVNLNSISFRLQPNFSIHGMESIQITSGVLYKHTVPYSESEALACQFHDICHCCTCKFAIMVAIPLKHEIPGQNKVIPGSLDTPSKSVKSRASLDGWQLCVSAVNLYINKALARQFGG